MNKIIMNKNIIIKRSELELIKKLGKRIWIIGRRKTGKTFLVKNFFRYDYYFFVKRNGEIINEKTGEVLSYDQFLTLFKEIYKNNVIVIDEFHRINGDFFDFLHYISDFNIIAISSSLYYAKTLISSGSPLFGLFNFFTISLINEKDILLGLLNRMSGKELIEASVYLREPILLRSYFYPAIEFMSIYLFTQRERITGLLGEVFNEERKELTAVYQTILESISAGKNKSSEISSFLFSRKLIEKDNPGLIQRYLSSLVSIGLIEKIPFYKKKKFFYSHISPLFDLYFYLSSKYGYPEEEVPLNYIKEVVKEKLPYHVEQFFFNLFAKLYGLKKVKISDKDVEVDIALTKFNKLYLIAEVKWRNKVSKEEIKEIIKKFDKVEEKYGKVKEKYIIVIDEKKVDGIKLAKEEGIKVIDVEDIIKVVKKRNR